MNQEEPIFAWYTDAEVDRFYECPFEKVIFLDIDGVLNVEEEAYKTGVIIDPEKVKLLKIIVDKTGADIILSSSWKRGYNHFIEDGFQSKDPNFKLLYDLLTAEGLEIKGITPISDESGAVARPLEIREWLNRFYTVFSYVILDDDTFWNWGFLQRNVVTTVTEHPENGASHRYATGMTMEHALKAIEILNDTGALKVKWD